MRAIIRLPSTSHVKLSTISSGSGLGAPCQWALQQSGRHESARLGPHISLSIPLDTLSSLSLNSNENELRFDGRWHGRRIGASTPAPSAVQQRVSFRDATYCISGGQRGLGLVFAKQLASDVSCLLLPGKSGVLSSDDLCSLAEKVDGVWSVSVDVCDLEAMHTMHDWAHEWLPPQRGSAHAAGISSFGMVGTSLTWDDIWQTSAPKMIGAKALHAANQPLDECVLFSSISAVWAQSGMAAYATANRCLDVASVETIHSGAPVTCIDFGFFAGTGMITRGDGNVRLNTNIAVGLFGLLPLSPEAALHAISQIVSIPRFVPAPLDLRRFTCTSTQPFPTYPLASELMSGNSSRECNGLQRGICFSP
jgi:NAD(P)-dependent dehydrogenase (short-subunit alcohol dehydrogenase family)